MRSPNLCLVLAAAALSAAWSAPSTPVSPVKPGPQAPTVAPATPGAGAASGLGLSIRLGAEGSFFAPVGDTASYFGLGGGGALDMNVAMPNLPWLAARGGIAYGYRSVVEPVRGMTAFDATLGAEARMPIATAFEAAAFFDGGVSFAGLNDGSASGAGGLFVFGAGIDWYFLPNLGVGLSASYRHYLGLTGGFNLGLGATWRSASLRAPAAAATSSAPKPAVPSAQPTKAAKPATAKVPAEDLSLPLELELVDAKLDRLFPVFFGYYDDHPLGTVTLRNPSKRAATNVEVRFFIPRYMDAPKTCALVPSIKPGESVKVPVYAVLRDSVLGVTETTKASAELKAEWKDAGTARQIVRNETVTILDRNAMTWDDDRKAAAFVTAKDPVIVNFAKKTVSAVSGRCKYSIDDRLITGMAIYSALVERGTAYAQDPTTPYEARGTKAVPVDYLQFPRQTLGYKAGDCDDLSILFASMLESVGVETAFVTTPGHILIAFALETNQAQSKFSNPRNLISRDGKLWLPLEVTALKGTFSEAWSLGARAWLTANAKGKAGFFPVRSSWESYPPAGLPGAEALVDPPATLQKRFDAELSAFIKAETAKRVTELKNAAAKAKTPDSENRLGVFYAQWGMYDDAEVVFGKLANAQPPLPAAVLNLANVKFIRADYKTALALFGEAESLMPGDGRPVLGLAKTQYALGDFAAAKKTYARLAKLDPRLAKDNAYLGTEGGARNADMTKPIEALDWTEK